MAFFISIAVIFLLLCLSELLWRNRDIDAEYMRKFVHISVGSFVAFWPFFLSQQEIALLSGAFVLVVGLSSRLHIFTAIHSVQRPTWGEIFFALAVGILAYVAHDKWIYTAALLHMSLADGLAAVIGTKFGKKSRYYIFGHAKSLAGTLAFSVSASVILAGYCILAQQPPTIWLLGIAATATVLENIAIRGLDNLLVPLLVAMGLNALR
jgi:phytol kinase